MFLFADPKGAVVAALEMLERAQPRICLQRTSGSR
jgi:hypothetical protein